MGSLEGAFRGMASPAQNLELPIGMPTYSTADLRRTVRVFEDYGVHLLFPDEITQQLPLYPKPLASDPGA